MSMLVFLVVTPSVFVYIFYTNGSEKNTVSIFRPVKFEAVCCFVISTFLQLGRYIP
jgi:hypothetical protein